MRPGNRAMPKLPRLRPAVPVPLVGGFLLAGLGLFVARAGPPQTPAPPFNRTAEVRVLLQQRCLECHGGKKTRGGLDLATREGLLAGGDSGPAVVPGDAKKSLLHRLVAHAAKPT